MTFPPAGCQNLTQPQRLSSSQLFLLNSSRRTSSSPSMLRSSPSSSSPSPSRLARRCLSAWPTIATPSTSTPLVLSSLPSPSSSPSHLLFLFLFPSLPWLPHSPSLPPLLLFLLLLYSSSFVFLISLGGDRVLSDSFRFLKRYKIQFVAPPVGGMWPIDQVPLLPDFHFTLIESLLILCFLRNFSNRPNRPQPSHLLAIPLDFSSDSFFPLGRRH